MISSYFAVRATSNAKRADEKAAETTTEKNRGDVKAKEARRHLYVARMNLAQMNWESSRFGAVLELLDRDEEDLRGFEWHYWSHLAHSYLLSWDWRTDRLTSLVFSMDGTRLASASCDRAVKVWDATTGAETLTLKGHSGAVWPLPT